MRDRNIEIRHYQDREKPAMHIEVKVAYKMGGMNYFDNSRTSRGFYLTVQPHELDVRETYTAKSFMLGSGAQKFIVAAERYSDKAFAQAIEKIKLEDAETGIIEKVVRFACGKSDVVFEDYDIKE